MSVRLSVRLKLKISVTAELIGLYFLGYIPIGPVVVLSYFIGGWDTPNPSQKWKSPPQKEIIILGSYSHKLAAPEIFLKLPLGTKPLVNFIY